MRIRSWTCVCLLLACGGSAAETAAVRLAREHVEHTRKLAEAGAASRRQVDQAEAALRQAIGDAVIAETLDAPVAADDLTEEQSTAATAAAARRVQRLQLLLAGQARLVSEGVAPRTSLVPFEQELESARQLADAVDQRARRLSEIAGMIRAEQEASDQPAEPVSIADGALARVTRYTGENKFGNEEFKQVVLEFEQKFDHKLPVSARGETALHRAMGFDHRGRVDVALNPDGVEGRWLMRFLEQQRIPFFAFRTAVRGQATAPHIHIGPPSARLRASD